MDECVCRLPRHHLSIFDGIDWIGNCNYAALWDYFDFMQLLLLMLLPLGSTIYKWFLCLALARARACMLFFRRNEILLFDYFSRCRVWNDMLSVSLLLWRALTRNDALLLSRSLLFAHNDSGPLSHAHCSLRFATKIDKAD